MSAIDVSRAYFNASTDESAPTYVMLPLEHPAHSKVKCGLLREHMYETRVGADGWQQEYSSFMKGIGFVQGIASPCFVRKTRNSASHAHGDNFTSVVAKLDLDWLESAMDDKYELRKGGRLRPGRDDAKEILVLICVIRYTTTALNTKRIPSRENDFWRARVSMTSASRRRPQGFSH